MRHTIVVALLCLFSVFVFGQVEQQITKMEEDWSAQTPIDGAAAVEKYEAADIITTNPDGSLSTKVQDKAGFTSGDIKFQSMKLMDLKVVVHGDTAIANGINDVKMTLKGKSMDGRYRFTDTWVKHDGKWQVVASQVTKIEEQK